MLDPLILKLISISFGLLFLLAAVHKLTALPKFRNTLAAYELLPTALITPVSFVVPVIETGLGAMWLLGIKPTSVAVASASLNCGQCRTLARTDLDEP